MGQVTHIQVLINYGGKLTQDLRILPGVYAIDDPRLFGLWEYLVEKKHARAIETPEPPAITTIAPVVAEVVTEVEEEATETGISMPRFNRKRRK